MLLFAVLVKPGPFRLQHKHPCHHPHFSETSPNVMQVVSCRFKYNMWMTPTDTDDKSQLISFSPRNCLWISASSLSMLVWRTFPAGKTVVGYASLGSALPKQRHSFGTQDIDDVTSIPLFWHSSN